MGKKSYLSQQIQLLSLSTSDLFTDEEYELYEKVISLINDIDAADDEKQKNSLADPTVRIDLISSRKEAQQKLNELISSHSGTPRTVRIKSVLDTRTIRNANGDIVWPEGVTWKTIKTSRKVAEFASEASRAMGLSDREITFDKVIIKWKSLDILKQIVLDGFVLPILHPDGHIEKKHLRFMTASAGQLRTDKVQCMADDMWEKIKGRIMCGLDYDEINAHGGINVSKIMAYTALPCSATDPWPEMSIDRCIVVEDFEAPVSGMTQYIDSKYHSERGTHETVINHIDGCGLMLPSVSTRNFMVRAPWIKGLLATFDYIKFCRVHDVQPVIKDIWGVEHDLVKENIQVIFTKSQFKLWKYYNDWDDYKKRFKENNCSINRTNYEEDYIPDTEICYQMLQTLTDFDNEEIEQFTKNARTRIQNIATDKAAMLRTLRADEDSLNPYNRALGIYEELVRDGYSRDTLKDIKKKWLLDGKSGKIKCRNKRLFVIPDLYAACEYWFLGIKEPQGLLLNGEVACRPYRERDKVACLRSPHLYMEWAIRNVVDSEKIYEWFVTNGIYTSCHDLISKILQFDCDGDQLNVVADDLLISIAERNIAKYDVVPLLYELGKAPPEQLNQEAFFNGLKRAHDYSGIGQVSNSLTKLWNKEEPDREVAAWLCFYNNLVIDAAKTGFVNGFDQYPEINKRVNKAIGGKNGRMPYFFQFSKNGRKASNVRLKDQPRYAKPNNSTMNRMCNSFSDVGNIKMNFTNVPPFNWQMLLPDQRYQYSIKAVERFCELDDGNLANMIESREQDDLREKTNALGYELLKDEITEEMISICGSLECAYQSVAKFLFAGANANKSSHKQMFWRVFGDLACVYLRQNMKNYSVCDKCGAKIPIWADGHTCPKTAIGFFECIDCGTWCERTNSRQCRCADCQDAYGKLRNLKRQRLWYSKNKETTEAE